MLSYADDTTLHDSSNDLDQLVNKINTELNNIYVWLSENKLMLNITKSNFILFGPVNTPALSRDIVIKTRHG